MRWFRAIAALVFAAAAVYGARAAYEAYELLQFYTHVEPDRSNAEVYEVELWLALSPTLVCGAVSLALLRSLIARKR